MPEDRTGSCAESLASRSDVAGSVRRGLRRLGRRATTLLLDFFVIKPIAIFVWWFSHRANTLHFRGRRELIGKIESALVEGRPVIVAVNHVSWFDDPVIPMALHRTGQGAALEIVALSGFAIVCWLLPSEILPPPAGVAAVVAGAAATALFGARKVWWTLGDRVNLSDASVLRGKLALTRNAPPGPLLRVALDLADRLIPWFMSSDATKTILVDRRPGEAAKRARERAVAAAVERAERLEPVWVFFEGGRSRVPGTLAPARRGIGSLVLGLRERGRQPLVVVVTHRGMERLIPPGGSRFLSRGHSVLVRWSLFDVDSSGAAAGDAQAVADAVREAAVRLHAKDDSDPMTRA